MAQRWTFEEDLIVGHFSYEHILEQLDDELFDELEAKLKDKGYISRSRSAIQKRIMEFQYSFYDSKRSYISTRVKRLARVISNKDKKYDWSLRVDSFINKYVNDNDENHSDLLFESQLDLSYLEPLKTLGPTLNEVFFGFVRKKGISIPEICANAQVDKATISRIKNHPEKSISKPTAMCLCFGLQLTLNEAQQLIESAGHKLASNPVDLLVAAYFDAQNYDIFDANEQLYERELPILFGHTKKDRDSN